MPPPAQTPGETLLIGTPLETVPVVEFPAIAPASYKPNRDTDKPGGEDDVTLELGRATKPDGDRHCGKR